MDYEKKYKEALERAKGLLEGMDEGDYFASNEDIENIFPELKESEDEKIKREIVAYINELADLKNEKITTKWLAWLEKQGEPIDKEKVLIGARKDVALSIMNFLDRNTLGMCLSNIECADLESAVIDSDWSKVYDYMKKKLGKQGEKDKPKTWCAEDEQNLNVVLSFIPDECLRRWLKDKLSYDLNNKLDADKVIAWIVANICDFEYYVKWFKKDFGL